MAVGVGDLFFRLSEPVGPGGSQASSPSASLGGFCSTTIVSTLALNNLFDDVTGEENIALDVEYRCIFIHNASADSTLFRPLLWIFTEVAGGADAAIGLDPTGVTPYASASPQAVDIPDEGTTPSGVAFSAPISKDTALALPDLLAGHVHGIWYRRTATDSLGQTDDGLTIRLAGETA